MKNTIAANSIVFPADSNVTSTSVEAMLFVDALPVPEQSKYWPHIKAEAFLENLKNVIHKPLSIYPGNGTNFCGYGALSYLFLQDDPLGFAKLQLELYVKGQAAFGKVKFTPSLAIRKQAGRMHFKGVLDIHPTEQMWYLCLADHFKGYLNWINHNYDPGDEDKFWASVNYAKFNRMVRKLLHYKTHAKGSDLIRPRVKNIYGYIRENKEKKPVVLFINNRIVHKKNHASLKLGFPTHFIIVEKISMENNVITLVYWDYGGKTLVQMSTRFLRRIIFGITVCTKTNGNEN
jgi:hypothetical protein